MREKLEKVRSLGKKIEKKEVKEDSEENYWLISEILNTCFWNLKINIILLFQFPQCDFAFFLDKHFNVNICKLVKMNLISSK